MGGLRFLSARFLLRFSEMDHYIMRDKIEVREIRRV